MREKIIAPQLVERPPKIGEDDRNFLTRGTTGTEMCEKKRGLLITQKSNCYQRKLCRSRTWPRFTEALGREWEEKDPAEIL